MTVSLYLSCGHVVNGSLKENEHVVCPECHNLAHVTVSKCEYFDGCMVERKSCKTCQEAFYCHIQSRLVTTHCNFKLCTEKPNVAI